MTLMLIDRAGLRLPCLTFSWSPWVKQMAECEVCDSPGPCVPCPRLIGGLHCASQASHASLLAASLRETDRTHHAPGELPLYYAVGTQRCPHTSLHN